MKDPDTKLPGNSFGLLVDDLAGKVFVPELPAGAQPSSAGVNVADLNGHLIKTIRPGSLLRWLTQTNGSSVYGGTGDGTTIVAINASTLAVSKHSLPAGLCLVNLTSDGSRIWFSYYECADTSETGFGTYNPTTNSFTTYPARQAEAQYIVGSPLRPTELVSYTDAVPETFTLWNISSAPVATTQLSDPGNNYGYCSAGQITFISKGADIAFACGLNHLRILSATTLAPVATETDQFSTVAVGQSADGKTLAYGDSYIAGPDLYLVNTSAGLPGKAIRKADYGYESSAVNALGWGKNGRLYYVINLGETNTDYLHITTP